MEDIKQQARWLRREFDELSVFPDEGVRNLAARRYIEWSGISNNGGVTREQVEEYAGHLQELTGRVIAYYRNRGA